MNLNPITNPTALCVGLPIVLLFVFFISVIMVFNKGNAEARLHRERIGAALADARVDEMTGKNFRLYVMSVLAQQGYASQIPPQPHDIGTELVGVQGARRVSIEVIHYNKPLTPQSVRMAVENRARLDCTEAMVITNSTFREDARQLAAAEQCTLIDRDGLAEWVLQMQTGRLPHDLRVY